MLLALIPNLGMGGGGITAPVESPGVMGGSGRPVNLKKELKKLGRHPLDKIFDKVISEYYEEIVEKAPESVVLKAEKLVTTFKDEKTYQIEWEKFEQDLKKVKELLRLWEETLANEDDEEVLLMSL